MSLATVTNSPTNVETFTIVRLAHQNYAEVQTDFVRRHIPRLNEYWKVKKNDTDFHKIKFNKDFHNPLIMVQGWNKFRDFHNLPNNVEIRLTYYPNDNIFEVYEINALALSDHIPPFHSRSLIPQKTQVFDVDITPTNVDVRKLDLDYDFANFIQKWSIESIMLCGDNGRSYTIDVLNISDIERIKLGFNWNYICEDLKFKPGNTVRFKFEINNHKLSRRSHIFKIL